MQAHIHIHILTYTYNAHIHTHTFYTIHTIPSNVHVNAFYPTVEYISIQRYN